MIQLFILALSLFVSQAKADEKTDAESAAIINSYARDFILSEQTTVRPVKLTDGTWSFAIPSRTDLAIVVAADFSASCLVQGKGLNVPEHLVGSLGSMVPQFFALSRANAKQCVAWVWESAGVIYAVAASKSEAVSARAVSAQGHVIEIQSIDASVSEVLNRYLSIELLLKSPIPAGTILRMAFQTPAAAASLSSRMVEIRGGRRYLRLFDAAGAEIIRSVCISSQREERTAQVAPITRDFLLGLSEVELDIELVPYSGVSRGSVDVAAYALCEES